MRAIQTVFFMAVSTAECALDSQVVNVALQERVLWESKDGPLQELSISLTQILQCSGLFLILTCQLHSYYHVVTVCNKFAEIAAAVNMIIFQLRRCLRLRVSHIAACSLQQNDSCFISEWKERERKYRN